MEKYLDDNAPDWRTYEDQMTDLLAAHPTLAPDPLKLYRLAVPDDVMERRATKHALDRVHKNVTAAKGSAGTTSMPRQTDTGPEPKNFAEAVEFAKRKLAAQGLTAPPRS